MWLTQLLNLLPTIMQGLGKLFLGLFVYNAGKTSQQADNSKDEVKDAHESAKINSGISGLADADLNAGLLDDRSTDK